MRQSTNYQNKNAVLKELRTIPGVGISIAQDLFDIGIFSIKQLKGKNPQNLYNEMCKKQKTKIDRCMLLKN